jgi:hypothetical protein
LPRQGDYLFHPQTFPVRGAQSPAHAWSDNTFHSYPCACGLGGEYRWHYDRNAVTGILYLNQVSGGETEMYPGCRIYLGRYKDTIAQRWLDKIPRQPFLLRLFGKKMCVAPRTGMMIVMRGDQCLHSVRRVESGERINIVMAFDRPGASFAVQKHLDSYLYSQSAAPQFDPNYRE